jgi:curved DNA-binding protein CbpA
MSDKDLYAILGVSPTASSAAIQRAYERKLAKYERLRDSASPKTQIQAEEAQVLVLEAGAVLRDPERRRGYDGRPAAATPAATPAAGRVVSLPRLRRTMPVAVGILVVAAGIEALAHFGHLVPTP